MRQLLVRGISILLLMVQVTTFSGCSSYTDGMDLSGSTEEEALAIPLEQSLEQAKIYVHVCGCVKHPDLYILEEGARVGDAVDTAGGFTEDADKVSVNLAGMLEDGMQVYIPSKEEHKSSDISQGMSEGQITQENTDKMNINLATEDELTSLPGIGEAKAKAIIAYRQSHGSFQSIDEIKDVDGIGESIFNRIKEYIKV